MYGAVDSNVNIFAFYGNYTGNVYSGCETSAGSVMPCNKMNQTKIFPACMIKVIMLLLFNNVDVSINKILQSKWVQSRIDSSFLQIKAEKNRKFYTWSKLEAVISLKIHN